MFGLLVLFGRGLGTRSATTEDRVNTFNLFSGSEIASNSTSFEVVASERSSEGAEVSATPRWPLTPNSTSSQHSEG